MKLNMDCVRDILLTVEETVDYSNRFTYSKDSENMELLKKYDHDEIMYHLRQCVLAKYFYEPKFDMIGIFHVTDLSYEGHDLLKDIRSNKVWEKVKTVSSEIGVFSIRAVKDIAVAVVAEMIRTALTQ